MPFFSASIGVREQHMSLNKGSVKKETPVCFVGVGALGVPVINPGELTWSPNSSLRDFNNGFALFASFEVSVLSALASRRPVGFPLVEPYRLFLTNLPGVSMTLKNREERGHDPMI